METPGGTDLSASRHCCGLSLSKHFYFTYRRQFAQTFYGIFDRNIEIYDWLLCYVNKRQSWMLFSPRTACWTPIRHSYRICTKYVEKWRVCTESRTCIRLLSRVRASDRSCKKASNLVDKRDQCDALIFNADIAAKADSSSVTMYSTLFSNTLKLKKTAGPIQVNAFSACRLPAHLKLKLTCRLNFTPSVTGPYG